MQSTKDKIIDVGEGYKNIEGIYVANKLQTFQGDNKKYSKFYNLIANLYDLGSKIFFGFYGGETKARNEFLEKISIRPNNNVLEVSIGTGINIQMLQGMANYYGVDVSYGMLKKCKRNFINLKKNVSLFLAEAENLPFNDGVFDCVFHVGGINYFNDKQKAINEMVRVAKSGAYIMIVDETDKFFEKFTWIPYLTRFFKIGASTKPPMNLLPKNVENISLNEVIGKNYWVLTFRKV